MFIMTKQESLKTEILDIGWKVLSEKGREAIRLRDLAKKGGCSVGKILQI